MGFHTFDPSNADGLEDPSRYEYVSVDELLALFEPHGTVADLGSGTGFYTDDVAPYAERVYAVDVQNEMHELYRQKGVPENVDCVTSEIHDLPFGDASIDCAFSTMTYHEFASDAALDELARIVTPGGLVGIADWTGNGTGEGGPPSSERYTLNDALTAFDNRGFEVVHADERRETFVLSVRRLHT